MPQCFERYGTRQKPEHRWLALWTLPNFLQFRDRPAVHISKTGYNKTYSQKEWKLYHIKNWRLLTLLKGDYKIATKAIANCLKTHLSKLINNDQTGFLKGRFIGENIRLILTAYINYTTTKKIPRLLLFLDFEKALNPMELLFKQKTLLSFGFGPSIVQWFKTFYNNMISCITNNGWASNFFSVHRGDRQGCPLSPYLFILEQLKFWPKQSEKMLT